MRALSRRWRSAHRRRRERSDGLDRPRVCVIERVSPDKDVKDSRLRQSSVLPPSCVGHSVNMNGTLGPQAEKVAEFASRLREATGLEVELWDERLSTMAAERALDEAGMGWRKKRKVVDMTAACLILQSYLESRRPGGDRVQ